MPKLKAIASINLQIRDFALLRGLFECRVMSKEHATELYFEGKSEAAVPLSSQSFFNS